MRARLLFVAAVLLTAQAAVALPSFMGYRGINRVVDARPMGEGEIAFGLLSRYWASTNDISDLEFHYYGPVYHDTLAVSDKEHYADAHFVVAYGLADFFELGARLSYIVNYYERDMVQPRGLITGRWDGQHGLGDVRLGWKIGFTPTPDNELVWLGMQNWWAFAPSSNKTTIAEDYDGRWFDDMLMYDVRRPMLSTGHTAYGVGALISLDLAQVWPSSPLRFHANLGYSHYKQNFAMTDFRFQYDSAGVTFSDSVDVDLTVEDDVFDIGAGIEFPTQFAILFVEYSMQNSLSRDNQNMSAYLSPGIRFITRAGAFMDITFDLGLTDFDPAWSDLGHTLYQQGDVSMEERADRTPLPFGSANDWGVGFALAFSSDLITEEVLPTEGRISGMITSSEDGSAVPATVSFPGTTIADVSSDPATGFYTVTVPGGSIPITVTAEGYRNGSATVVIEPGQSVVKDFAMLPELRGGIITGTVLASEDGSPIPATVTVVDAPEPISVTATADGVYQISAPAGTWTVKAEANGFLPKTQPVVVPPDGTAVLNFELRPALVQGQVLRFNNIYFDVASANLKPESFPVLDGVVATLLENPGARVQIAGHTDSDGSESYNQTLSEQRAASVFTYLVNHGVQASRLSTIGYGESSPVVPNTSSANKAQNRRIEFVVLSVN